MGGCASFGGGVSVLVPQQNSLRSISQRFSECGVIGHGVSGDIKRVQMRNRGDTYYALKSLDKNFSNKREFFRQEVKILRKLRHHNIIRLVDVFEDKQQFHIVTELCEGGDLAARICQYPHFTEKVAASMVKKMLEIVDYVHSNNIVHRDLKPANFVFQSTKKNDNEDIADDMKMIDFGAALMVKDDKTEHSMVGTAHYMAPELFNKKITKTGAVLKKSDVWSIGVITHVITTGKPPFDGSDKQIYIAARKGEPDFSDTNLSEEAREFIEFILKPNPEERPSIQEVLEHPWLSDAMTPHPIDVKVLEKLREFAVSCKKSRQRSKSDHLLRHFSSSSLLVTNQSSSNLLSRGINTTSPSSAPQKKISSNALRSLNELPNLRNNMSTDYNNTISSIKSHRFSSFLVTDTFEDINEEEAIYSSGASTPDSLSWRPPPLPDELNRYFSELDISDVVSKLDDEGRAQLTEFVSDIQGDKKLTEADLTEALEQLAEYNDQKSNDETSKMSEELHPAFIAGHHGVYNHEKVEEEEVEGFVIQGGSDIDVQQINWDRSRSAGRRTN